MAGTKRAAEEEHSGPTTRSAKAPKTEGAASPTKGRARGGKKGPKTTMAASQFKNRAMPLHVNITHTPPALPDAAGDNKETVTVASQDPGFIGTTTLVPSTFATGSYGWKGSKRVSIELQNADGADGEKEKVHVMITINATVMGSKGAKEDGGDDAKEDEHAEEQAEEGAEEAANGKENGAEPKEGDITEALPETEVAAQAEA